MDWMTQVQFLKCVGIFWLCHHIQSSSGANPGYSGLGVEQLGCNSDHTHTITAEVDHACICTATTPVFSRCDV